MSGQKRTNRKKASPATNVTPPKGAAPVPKPKTKQSPASPVLPATNGAASAGCTPPGAGQFGPSNNGYRTDYYIHIQGSLKPDGGHLLIINNTVHIKIDWLKFMILVVLASLARSKSKLSTPLDFIAGDYLQADKISALIEELKLAKITCAGQTLVGCTNASDPGFVHRAKWDLRSQIERQRLNKDLVHAIEGAGYRISTPPGRIKITLLSPDGEVVYHWAE